MKNLLRDKEGFMPAYEYICKDCNKPFTVFLSLREYGENPKIKCPGCGSDNVHRTITGFFAKTSRKS